MRFLFRTLALVALSAASACGILPADGGSRGGPDAPAGAGGAPLPAAAPAGRETELQSRARDFVTAVAAVEPIAERECRQRAPALDCDFLILVDDRPGVPANAYQLRDETGRPMIVFTLGLIAETRNADELAFVLAHEASHHILGHLDQQTRNAAAGAAALGQLATVLGTRDEAALRSAQQLGAVFGARSYSRGYELEADALGTLIAAEAGFDPLRGADFFMRIPDPGNRFLGSHPPNAERIAVVQRTVAALGG